MMSGTNLLDKSARFDTWPASDRQLWNAGCAKGDPFEASGRGANLARATLSLTATYYRHWLDFLAADAWDAHTASPRSRVTRKRLLRYLRGLRTRGLADWTIIGHAAGLERAIRIMDPSVERAWMRKLLGSTVYSMLPKRKRTLLVPDSGVLWEWAIELMDSVPRDSIVPNESCRFRNGLIFAILAARARRLRSITLLRLGYELKRVDGTYRVELNADQVKTGKADRFNLPAVLTPYIDLYLSHVRPVLLRGNRHDAVWINHRGKPLTAKALQGATLIMSKARFGVAFGPHRFRHSLATTAALRGYQHPGLAAAALGISGAVIQENYNRAGQAEAADEYARVLTARRKAIATSAVGCP